MGKVLKFDKNPVETADLDLLKSSLPSRKFSTKAVLAWTWFVLRLPLFFVLYWLRLPVTIICNLISVPTLLAFLFCWYAFPEPRMLWAFGVMSFTAFVVLWTYDFVLMALSPEPMMRTL